MKNTKIVSAFPCCGKTYYFENKKDLVVLDSDISNFSWIKDENGNNTKERNPEFPNNYIEHIKENIGKVDIIFVSSHKVVRDALSESGLNWSLVIPKKECLSSWVGRAYMKGSSTYPRTQTFLFRYN